MKDKRFLAAAALTVLVAAGAPGAAALAQEQETPREAQAVNSDIVVPEGTVLSVVLSTYLNTQSTQIGDTFYADVVYPIWLQQRLVIPKGSTVRGTVTEVIRPGRVKGKGRMAVRIDDILLPNGVKRTLNASFRGLHGPGAEKIDRKTETMEGGSTKGADAGTIIGPASTGGIIGAVAGGGKGAGIGAGAGAAAGLATVLFSRGKDLVLQPGTQFDLELKQPLKFASGELDFTNSELNSVRSNAPRQKAKPAPRPALMPGRRVFGIPWP